MVAAVKFQAFMQANAWAAKASLSSMRSMSPSVTPALANAAPPVAGTGPMPITSGPPTPPADAHDTSRTSGVRPSSAAFSGVVTMHIDAASFCPLELPAVTVASGSCFSRTGLSFLSDSRVVSARGGCSSVSITSSPRRLVTVTGMISSARMPSFFCAATAR